VTDVEHQEHKKYIEELKKVKNKSKELKKEKKNMLIETPTLKKNIYLVE